MRSRRDFLSLLGMAVGATLSGCGGSENAASGGFAAAGSGSSPALTPTAYRYLPLTSAGQKLAGDIKALPRVEDGFPAFPGGVQLNDQRHVFFHALDEGEVRGIYRIDVNGTGTPSQVSKIIREGDRLPDGTTVGDFTDGCVNNSDDFVLGISDSQGAESIQCSLSGGGFQSQVRCYKDYSAQAKFAGELSRVQSISDDGRVLFVGEYFDQDGLASGDGLFVMPVGRPELAELVLAHEQLIPGTSAVIQCFTHVQLCNGGRYLAQGTASSSRGQSSLNSDGKPMTFLVTGRIGEAPQALAVDPALGTPGRGYQLATCYTCARMTPDSIAMVLQPDSDTTQLWLNQTKLLEASLDGGSLSPRGSKIVSFLPPVFGPSGLLYFQVFTQSGMELILHNGSRAITLLAKGDQLLGKEVETILFGTQTEGVNAQGDFVTILEFSDGEVGVFLAVPV